MDFKLEWFNSQKNWFSKDPEFDKYISEKYSYLLDGVLTPFDKASLKIVDTLEKDFVTQILIYDQLPRHIYRNEVSAHIIEYFLQKALDIVACNLNQIDSLSDTEWIFVMLPIRHSKKRIDILKVIQLAWSRLEKNPESIWIKKFLRASYTQLNNLRQDALVTGQIISNISLDNYITILEGVSPAYLTDESPVRQRYDREKYKDISTFNIERNSNLIVSLSGGVDSMVAIDLLRKQKCNVIAVHINYCNRDTSYFEAEFVNWWCNQIGVKLYTRHISEFTRNQAKKFGLRDIYEEYTKNIRFNSYTTAAKLAGFDSDFKVVLGHNKDDTFENILTNITAQCKWDNLLGMELHSKSCGVCVYRPLINTSKYDIKQYASKNCIPYLYDSTSNICQRGKIRTNIVPVLNRWNPGSITGMHELSKIMSDLYTNNRVLVKMFVSELDNSGSIKCDIYNLSESMIFWRELFTQAKIKRPSNKSICNLINKINIIKKDYVKLHYNDPVSVVLTNNNTITFTKLKENIICVKFM